MNDPLLGQPLSCGRRAPEFRLIEDHISCFLLQTCSTVLSSSRFTHKSREEESQGGGGASVIPAPPCSCPACEASSWSCCPPAPCSCSSGEPPRGASHCQFLSPAGVHTPSITQNITPSPRYTINNTDTINIRVVVYLVVLLLKKNPPHQLLGNYHQFVVDEPLACSM